MENPFKMGDLGIPLFLETPIYACWSKLFLPETAIPSQKPNNFSQTFATYLYIVCFFFVYHFVFACRRDIWFQ